MKRSNHNLDLKGQQLRIGENDFHFQIKKIRYLSENHFEGIAQTKQLNK